MDLALANLDVLEDVIPFKIVGNQSLRFFSWTIVIFFSYCVAYNFLKRLVKVFVIHEAIPKVNQFRLVDAIWRLLFSTWVIVLFCSTSWTTEDSKRFDTIIQAATAPPCNVSSHNFEDSKSSEIILLIAPISFFTHQLYISISSQIFEPALLTMGCLSLFVYSTNSALCPYLCLQILFILALNVGTLELARAIYAFKSKCKGWKGPPAPFFLQVIATLVFILHVVAWVAVNFYFFPTLYLSLPSATQRDLPCTSATAYINIFLLFFAQQQFFNSPAWSLLKVIVRRPSERRKLPGLKTLPLIVLLPYTSSLLSELRAIQVNFLLDALPTSAERRMIRKKIIASGSQTSAPVSEGNADLLSIIKCVNILKRKMKYRYEQKSANEASEETIETQDSSNESDNEFSGSQENQDVTDIFFPVPTSSSVFAEKETEQDELSSKASSSAEISVKATKSESSETEKKIHQEHQQSDRNERQEDIPHDLRGDDNANDSEKDF